MKNKLYILFLVLIALVMAYSIGKKEYHLRNGEVFYLALAPVDPRSLMQGDYMTLDYDVNLKLPKDIWNSIKYLIGGAVVLEKDGSGIAEFVSLYEQGQKLKVNQFAIKLVRANRRLWVRGNVSVAPTSYMFQEGMAEKYSKAKYGILKHFATGSGPGEVLLIGLADDNLKTIK